MSQRLSSNIAIFPILKINLRDTGCKKCATVNRKRIPDRVQRSQDSQPQ
ncbi:hypothetical protein [Nostoc sp. 'Peltigera membranacea cyanobiont' N6]|nr:hypothetical protein [Nostoc sp. 'Peltigera membranacea cyanobiont' N6]